MKLFTRSAKFTQKRKYHIYGLAANYLKVAEHQLYEKESALRNLKEIQFQEGKIMNGSMSKFIKKAKNAPVLKQISEMEQTIEACHNIKRLCEEAYNLGKEVRENKDQIDYAISDELYDFICLTNDSYPCYIREDYERIKEIYKTK
jgi:hypothetical protein